MALHAVRLDAMEKRIQNRRRTLDALQDLNTAVKRRDLNVRLLDGINMLTLSILEALEKKKLGEMRHFEWKMVAKAIDHILFVIFLSVLLVFSVIVLLAIPIIY